MYILSKQPRQKRVFYSAQAGAEYSSLLLINAQYGRVDTSRYMVRLAEYTSKEDQKTLSERLRLCGASGKPASQENVGSNPLAPILLREGDLLSGAKNSYIATLVERHSRFLMLIKVPSKDTAVVVAALSKHVRICTI